MTRMGCSIDAYGVLEERPEGKKPHGSSRYRLEDNIQMGLQEVIWGCTDWIDLVQDRDRWRTL